MTLNSNQKTHCCDEGGPKVMNYRELSKWAGGNGEYSVVGITDFYQKKTTYSFRNLQTDVLRDLKRTPVGGQRS